MPSIDYRKLGLKVGLELHQQLDTKEKLFCHCPARLEEDAPEDVFTRRLRPTQSELGEVDVAALFEWKKGRAYEYHAPRTASCLVEADEEPPHELNKEALIIALAVAKALKARPVDEVHVMRKIVIDGSNTTGFQRTAVIALGGEIDIGGKTIRIQTICLEEDAARKIGEKGKIIEYKLDRLCIPLIEISTAPDIETPEEAEKAALAIGQLLRLTGKVKRGIGTIRQDLNVSIEGGTRTEIKGVQRLDLIAKVVEYEVMRQLKLLEIRDELKKRGVREEDVVLNPVDVTQIFANTKCKIIAKAIKRGAVVLAQKLPGFKGLLGVEVQPGRRFGTELADYARFWGGVGGIFHTDELPAYGITEDEVKKVCEAVGADMERDAVVIVADERGKAMEALKAVVDRAREALKGIPKETRAANPDGTTRFMRPQPGAARMYPETDIPPVEITQELLAEAEKLVPEPPAIKYKKLVEEHGLSEDLAKQMLRSVRLDLYEKLVEKYRGKLSPVLIASTIEVMLKGLKSEGVDIEAITDEHIEETLDLVARGVIAKEAIPEVLKWLSKNPQATAEEAVKALGLGAISREELERLVAEVVEQMRDFVLQRGERAFGPVMGKVMSKVRGKADGKVVASLVKQYIEKVLSEGK